MRKLNVVSKKNLLLEELEKFRSEKKGDGEEERVEWTGEERRGLF